MKNKNAFTLVEVLAVIVLLGVLAVIAMPTVNNYVDEARKRYNNQLENQLLISAKAYFSDNKNLLPRLTYAEKYYKRGKSTQVSVQELYTKNYLKQEIVDYDGNKCNGSYVEVTKNSTSEEEIWRSCLICGEDNKVLSDDPDCISDFNANDHEQPICTIKLPEKPFKGNNLELEFEELSDSTEYADNKKYSRISFENVESTANDEPYYIKVSDKTESDIKEMDFKELVNLPEGTYKISIYDKGNNKAECVTGVVIDNTDPACHIETTDKGDKIELKSVIDDPTEILDPKPYSWEGKNGRTEYSDKNTYEVSENYEYKSHVKDAAGNEGSCSLTVLSLGPSEPNAPILSENMIPVYYDYGVWKKADKTNTSETHKWYDYDAKMWANSVTVSNTNRDKYLDADPGEDIPMEDILTMQVWIPRYKYTVWNYNSDGNQGSNPQQINIRFEQGTETTGEIDCDDNIQGTSTGTTPPTSETCTLKATDTTCTDSTCNGKTYTHPAFTFGTKELKKELKGIWVGKFEVGTDVECTANQKDMVGEGCNLETIKPLVKPDIKSWNGAMVGVFAHNIMAMNDNGNQYGFATSDDTHMIKNSEWGAVAYLSHSKYGTCTNGVCKEVYVNNSSGVYTGRSGGNVGGSLLETIDQFPNNEIASNIHTIKGGYYTYDDYKMSFSGSIVYLKETGKGTGASTTGNVYGVYDMSGGFDEYVMGNVVSPDGKTMMSGYDQKDNEHSGYSGITYRNGNSASYVQYNGKYEYPDPKYYDKYSSGNAYGQQSRSKLGDGIKEVFNSEVDGFYNGWYDDSISVVGTSSPWQIRGDSYKASRYTFAGIFTSSGYYGSATSNTPSDTLTNTSSRIAISQ